MSELKIEIKEKNNKIILNELPKSQYRQQKDIVYSNDILPIELNPTTEAEFKRRLLLTKTAYITIFYKNGKSEQKIWYAHRFKKSSGVLGNLRSWPAFRKTE